MKAKSKWKIASVISALALVGGMIGIVGAGPAFADATGANATKACTDPPAGTHYTLGSVIPCTATFTNTGLLSAHVDSPHGLTEQAPFLSNGNPGNGPITDITCATQGNPSVGAGSALAPADPCTANFNVTVPNDPALCGTFFRDRVEVDLTYASGLTAGAFATNTVAIVCPVDITVVKTADALSKPTDPVNYTVKICNVGHVPATKVSVGDTLVGDISGAFSATLAVGACETDAYSRTVLASDLPGPIVNTVTATYTNGIDPFNTSDTASSTATTDLFVPSVDVQKDCGPALVQVGETEVCHIHVQNTSGGTTPPALTNGSITDSLDGDLLTAGNPAVVASTCSGGLATGASCDITTNRVVLASDTSPLSDTVVVHYNPSGFPNDVTDTASDNVIIVSPIITIAATATPLSKATDDVTYLVTICNTGQLDVTRSSVIATVLGNITADFPVLLAANSCASPVSITRTVLAGDPNPLVVTFTATYSGIVIQAVADTTVHTDLFVPGVDVTKNCSPNPIDVGAVEHCVIDVTNTSTGTTPPALTNGTIQDTLSGNLLAAGNPAVTSSTCTTSLATGATCEIVTARTVLASDLPGPIVNTVAVHYNPSGFPNSIDDSATATVAIKPPVVTHQCTLGYWKQSQHFSDWRVYSPNQLWNSVFLPLGTVNAGSYKGSANPTLLSALQAGGGGVNDFARHAVAELLNSSSLSNPNESTAQVIAEVNAAITAYNASNPKDISILTTLAAKYDAQQNADNCTGFLNRIPASLPRTA